MNLPDLELIVKMLSILHQSDGPSMPFKTSILQQLFDNVGGHPVQGPFIPKFLICGTTLIF